MKRTRGSGSLFVMSGPFEQRADDDVLWIRYCQNGKVFRESTHSTKIRDAERLLKSRIADSTHGTLIESADRRRTVDDIYQLLLAEYRNNGMPSLVGAQQRWEYADKTGKLRQGRLKDSFGGCPASGVDKPMLNRYVEHCRAQGLANGTINRDLSALRRSMHLAVENDILPRVPIFPRLKESAPRAGFVEEPQFEQLKKHAKELWLRALVTVAYHSGFRKGELLNLRVRQVDLLSNVIRLNAGETKSGAGRVVVVTQDESVLLAVCCAGKNPDDYVFTRAGNKPVRGFRKAWAALTRAAGCPDLLFHDLRRSAVREMVRAGIPQQVAMARSGHKTQAVFARYNIVSESDMQDAARKLEARSKRVLAEFWQNQAEPAAEAPLAAQPSALSN